MREIKFRAWTRAGEWSEDGQQDFIMIGGDDLAFEDYAPLIEQLTETEDFKPMQFTGLLDKNGEEIYEGDVVKGKYYESGSHRFIGEVIFECGSWWVRGVKQFREYRQLKDVHNIQVIGNIHENKELIK